MNNNFKSIITPGVALFIFVAILLVCLLISGFCNPNCFESTRTKIFLTCLAGLGIFVTFMFYYSIVSIQQAQQRIDTINLTSSLSQLLSKGVVDQLHIATEKIPKFTMSLFPLLICKNKVSEDDIDNPENCILKFKISYKIFTLWQELLLATPFLDIDKISYLCIFLQRANSKLLYEQWLIAKIDFNKETQLFGDLLFDYGLNIKKQTSKEYIKIANKLLCNTTFKNLIYA